MMLLQALMDTGFMCLVLIYVSFSVVYLTALTVQILKLVFIPWTRRDGNFSLESFQELNYFSVSEQHLDLQRPKNWRKEKRGTGYIWNGIGLILGICLNKLKFIWG